MSKRISFDEIDVNSIDDLKEILDEITIKILSLNSNNSMLECFEKNSDRATNAALNYLMNYIRSSSTTCYLKYGNPDISDKEIKKYVEHTSNMDIIYGIISSVQSCYATQINSTMILPCHKIGYMSIKMLLDNLYEFITDNINESIICKYFDKEEYLLKDISIISTNIIQILVNFIVDGGECTDKEMVSASIKAIKALMIEHEKSLNSKEPNKETTSKSTDDKSEKKSSDNHPDLADVMLDMQKKMYESDESPIKIIKPSVQILKTSFDNTDVARSIEKVARTCYKSEDKITDSSAEKMVKGLLKSEHMAMFEHETITVLFRCDRGVSHEIVRHRLASYAQESTRYCNYSNGKFDHKIEVINPTFGFNDMDEKSYHAWKKAMENAANSYFELIDLGMAPQMARDVLPTSVATSIVVTMNLREWRHFIKLRSLGTTGAPHPQMKYLASKLLEELGNKYPIIFGDLLEEYNNSNEK